MLARAWARSVIILVMLLTESHRISAKSRRQWLIPTDDKVDLQMKRVLCSRDPRTGKRSYELALSQQSSCDQFAKLVIGLAGLKIA